jgi:hypothetical protein
MKTQLKVIALSVLVATSVHAKESKDMYVSLGAVQTKKANGKLLMKTTSKPHLSV